ncbi:MAG: hypothetical protein JKY67_04985 [Pseudomonadales bacterium]|nr:hypothetical protein [Pseudomonadales bacterium]
MIRILSFIILLMPSLVFAHGGVSIEDDVCIIRLNNYKAHFTGYMPEQRGVREFCESFPVTGRAIIAIDFISGELREQRIKFEVARDFTGKGSKVTASDLQGASKTLYKEALIHSESAAFRDTGTINFSVDLNEKGWYIGVMKIVSDDGVVGESVFPFNVAPSTTWRFLLIIPGVLILVIGLLWVSGTLKR